MELTPKQKAELEALNNLPDDEIDFSDAPEVTDFNGTFRGYWLLQAGIHPSVLATNPRQKAEMSQDNQENHTFRVIHSVVEIRTHPYPRWPQAWVENSKASSIHHRDLNQGAAGAGTREANCNSVVEYQH